MNNRYYPIVYLIPHNRDLEGDPVITDWSVVLQEDETCVTRERDYLRSRLSLMRGYL